MARSADFPPPTTTFHKVSLGSHHSYVERKWLEEHKAKLFTGIGGVVGLCILLLFLIAYQRRQNTIALEHLRLGIASFHAEKFTEAIPFLEKAKNLLGPRKIASQVALFYLNEAFVRSGQLDQIKLTVDELPLSSKEAYLSQIILLSLGRIVEKRGDKTSARELYDKAAALEGPLNADALLKMGYLAEAVGDNNATVAAREKFLEAHPNSPLADIVRKHLGK